MNRGTRSPGLTPSTTTCCLCDNGGPGTSLRFGFHPWITKALRIYTQHLHGGGKTDLIFVVFLLGRSKGSIFLHYQSCLFCAFLYYFNFSYGEDVSFVQRLLHVLRTNIKNRQRKKRTYNPTTGQLYKEVNMSPSETSRTLPLMTSKLFSLMTLTCIYPCKCLFIK